MVHEHLVVSGSVTRHTESNIIKSSDMLMKPYYDNNNSKSSGFGEHSSLGKSGTAWARLTGSVRVGV